MDCWVEPGDPSPRVPGPSPLVTEGSWELVPVSVTSHSVTTDIAGSSHSHPDTAGLMGATFTAPIASSPQMLGSVGAASNPDANADTEAGFGPTLLIGLVAGSEVQPTQPPHPPLDIDIPSRYPDVSGTTMGDSDMSSDKLLVLDHFRFRHAPFSAAILSIEYITRTTISK